MNSQEVDVIELLSNNELIEEARKVVMSKDSRSLKQKLNDASWRVKQMQFLELLEKGDIQKAGRLASEILDLTEAKKQEIKGHMLQDQRILVVAAEVEALDDETLFRRAEEIRQSRTLPAPSGDAEERSGEILEVEDDSVSERSSPVLQEGTEVQSDTAADEPTK